MGLVCNGKGRVVEDLLRQVLSERSALVVDGEGGDLLDQLQKIYCAVEQRWFEVAFEINIGIAAAVC
jgi:hypothetical protein